MSIRRLRPARRNEQVVRENLDQVGETINTVCIRVGKKPGEVTLVAVSKTKPVPMLEETYVAGTRDFGRNKVQEILAKELELPQDTRWHMIGRLQHNKISQVIGNATMIHSIDSLCLVRQIEAEAAKKEMGVDILLEVNVAREGSKYGFMLEEVEDAVIAIEGFPHVHIRRLMTVAPFAGNPGENRGIFKKSFEFAVDIGRRNIDNVTTGVLSMGITGDYEAAAGGGVTMVRVGIGTFGIR